MLKKEVASLLVSQVQFATLHDAHVFHPVQGTPCRPCWECRRTSKDPPQIAVQLGSKRLKG